MDLCEKLIFYHNVRLCMINLYPSPSPYDHSIHGATAGQPPMIIISFGIMYLAVLMLGELQISLSQDSLLLLFFVLQVGQQRHQKRSIVIAHQPHPWRPLFTSCCTINIQFRPPIITALWSFGFCLNFFSFLPLLPPNIVILPDLLKIPQS